MKTLPIAAAILIATGVAAWMGRYDIQGDALIHYSFDRWTGEEMLCRTKDTHPGYQLLCAPMTRKADR